MIGATIYNILNNNVSVKSLTGGRIYPGIIPQEETQTPVIVYNVLSNKDEVKGFRNIMYRHRVQIDIYAESYAEMEQTGIAVNLTLDLLRNVEIDENNKIDSIYFIDMMDGYDQDRKLHRRTLEYAVRQNIK